MKRLLVSGAIVALLSACNSQSDDAVPAASESATAPTMTAATEAPANPDATGAPGADLAALKKGDILIAIKATQCRETGANAGEPPWDVAVGSFAKFVAAEGADVRVELAGDECLIPADAVKLSAS